MAGLGARGVEPRANHATEGSSALQGSNSIAEVSYDEEVRVK